MALPKCSHLEGKRKHVSVTLRYLGNRKVCHLTSSCEEETGPKVLLKKFAAEQDVIVSVSMLPSRFNVFSAVPRAGRLSFFARKRSFKRLLELDGSL